MSLLSVPSLVATAATFLQLVPAVRAASVDDIEIANTVKAGEATSVDISYYDASDDDSHDDVAGIRVYLALTPPGWGTGPVCWVVNYTDPSSASQVDVTVPAAAAPDGSVLSLSYSFVDDQGYSSATYGYSNDFTLQGGSGNWSAMELNGYGISSPDYCPCTSLQCARDCSDKYYPSGELSLNEQNDIDEDVYLAWYDCVSTCPGTTYPAYDESDGDDDGDDGNGDGIQTSTQTAASASATSSSSSSTSTTTSSSRSTVSATSSSAASQTTSTTTMTTTATASSGASRTALTMTALVVSCLGMVSWWL